MEVERLPVYNELRRLFEQFEKSTMKVPINIKRGAISQVEQWLIEMLDLVTFANNSSGDKYKRVNIVQDCSILLDKVKIRVRTLHSLGFIPKTGFSAVIELEDSVARQLAGWSRKTLKEIV